MYLMRRNLGGLICCGAVLICGCQIVPHAPKPSNAGPAIPAAALEHGNDQAFAQLTGGDLGIGGGFLVGASPEKCSLSDRKDALAAAQKAEQSPATLLAVRDSTNADLNHDGYITLDEILAMVRSGLSEQEVAARLKNSQYVFHITPQQERYLSDRGVPANVVKDLHNLSGTTTVARQ